MFLSHLSTVRFIISFSVSRSRGWRLIWYRFSKDDYYVIENTQTHTFTFFYSFLVEISYFHGGREVRVEGSGSVLRALSDLQELLALNIPDFPVIAYVTKMTSATCDGEV